MSQCCSCGSDKLNLIYSCSGAANTGYLADSVARKLMKENYGKMTCLAAVGADLSRFIESAKSAEKNILIDGCNVSCGKKILENHGLPFEHFILTDFNVEKGKTEITQQVIENAANQISVKFNCILR